jgi:hypothetical protein
LQFPKACPKERKTYFNERNDHQTNSGAQALMHDKNGLRMGYHKEHIAPLVAKSMQSLTDSQK